MAAARAAAAGAGVLAGVAGVDQLEVGLAQAGGELLGGEAELGADARRELGAGRRDGAGGDGPSLVDPAVPAPLEHADGVVAVVVQGPPEPGGELAAAVVDGDDVGLVADPALGHRLGESLRRGDLGGDRIVGVDDVAGPVDVDRARDVAGEVFLRRPAVVGVLDARLQRAGDDVAPHVDHADVGVVEVGFQPVGRDEQVVRFGHGVFPVGFAVAFPLR